MPDQPDRPDQPDPADQPGAPGTPGATRVRITVGSGTVLVVGESRTDVVVDGAAAPISTDEAGELRVRGGSSSFTVRVPAGSDVVVGSDSGNVTLEGSLGAVSITTTSADVRVDEVASIDARTVSGKLRVDVSHGAARLRTKSARVRIRRVEGDVRIANVSGDIEIEEALGEVAAKSVSGSIDLRVVSRAPVGVETVSGTIKVLVPPGVKPEVRHRSMSGKYREKVETGTDVIITARSISGDITIGAA